MDLLDLPREILLKIVTFMHDSGQNIISQRAMQCADGNNLTSIIMTCITFRDVVYKNWKEIIDYYTTIDINRVGNIIDISYRFCGKLHRDGDRPAAARRHITPSYKCRCEYWKYYRYGKLHRGDDRPAVIDRYYNRCDWYEYGQNVATQSPIPKKYIDEARKYAS